MARSNRLSKAIKAIVAAPLLAGAMSASAALIEVQYTGTVDYSAGDGAGYSIGDVVSGSLFIDTDLAPADSYSAYSALGNYYNTTDGNDFVSGYSPNDSGLYDQVYLEDDYYGNRDYFYIIDRDYERQVAGNTVTQRNDYLQLVAYDYSFDFINGSGLDQEFTLSSGDVAYFYGNVYNRDYTRTNGRVTQNDYGHSRFALNSLQVGPAAVPAPGSLALMALGLLGLGVARGKGMIDR